MILLLKRKKTFSSIKVKMDNLSSIKSYAFVALKSINILVSLLLLVSYMTPYTDPNRIPIIALIGLVYPITFIMNILFLVVWGLLKSKWFFLSASILLIGIPLHLKVFSINLSNNEIPKNSNPLKIMSYNVRLFGYFNDSRIGANKKKNQILNFIRQEQPDVLCIQEYFHQDGDNKFNTKDSIYDIMGIHSHHEKIIQHSQKNKHFGMALFSKYPIINEGIIHRNNTNKKNSNFCIYADIIKKGDTIRIYNIHFQSIKLKVDEYSRQRAINASSKMKQVTLSSGLLKLNEAFKIRSKQSHAVRSHVNKSPYKSIVCGDFNDTPMSYTYEAFDDYLVDAFRNTSTGLGSTYNGFLPAGRIDYIFHTKSLNSADFKIQSQKLSDHQAITCIIY